MSRLAGIVRQAQILRRSGDLTPEIAFGMAATDHAESLVKRAWSTEPLLADRSPRLNQSLAD
jgi:hypothetical protein